MAGLQTRGDKLADPRLFGPAFLIATALVCSWFANQNLPTPDESANLAAAAKILDGQVFYRDIDAYPFPGSTYLLALWMAVFGESVGAARALAALVFCGFAAALYASSLQLLERRSAALFALSLLPFKFLGFPNFTAYLYSDIALAFAAIAIALFLRAGLGASARALAGTGAAVGAAILCKQSTGLYLGLAMGLLILFPSVALASSRDPFRERLMRGSALALGALAVTGPALLYFAWEGVLGEMLYSGLVRPFTGYLPTSGVPFGPLLAWWQFGTLEGPAAQPYFPLRYSEMLYAKMLPNIAESSTYWRIGEVMARALYSSIPIVFILWCWRRFRASRTHDASHSPLFVFSILALSVVASAFPRADYSHIINVYPVFLLAMFALAEVAPRARLSRPAILSQAAIVSSLFVLVGIQARWYDRALTYPLELERASLRVKPQDAWVGAVVSHIREHTPEGEALFVYGHEAYFYFLSDRYFPWRFLQLYPGMAGGDDGEALARTLIENRPRFVAKGLVRWPGMPTLSRYTPALATTIFQNYEETAAWHTRGVQPPSKSIFALFESAGSGADPVEVPGNSPGADDLR